jgi:hypothetical protein
VAVYAVAKLADFAWYRSQVSADFRDANWSGHWETKGYGGLSGRLLVRLPDPLPEDVDFRAQALVYYPIYSVWKTGQFVRMDFAGRFSSNAPASGGRSTNPISPGGLLKFKGMAGRQVVEYAALVDESQTRIVGGYLSHDPHDYGHFFIRRD